MCENLPHFLPKTPPLPHMRAYTYTTNQTQTSYVKQGKSKSHFLLYNLIASFFLMYRYSQMRSVVGLILRAPSVWLIINSL